VAASEDPVNLAVQETVQRARRLFSSGVGTTLEILKEADKQLSQKLHHLVAAHGGPTGSFTEAHASLWRKQIKLATEYLESRMVGHTHAQALKGVAVGIKDTVTLGKQLEKKFSGITRPLALESQSMQDEVTRGTGSSLLRRHQSSVARYGQAMVGDFERVLRVAQVEGLDQHQTISRLVDTGKLGSHSARSLHAKEPGSFPEPTSFVKRRYWAERIVRTETAYAYNAASLQAMNVTRATEFPDMCKKILATFDARTASDSKAVHGQVRKLEEMFLDGAGRQYLHPPARPNDRETVIPWRPHWEELPATHELPPAAQAAAQATAAPVPNQSAEQKKQQMLTALQAAKGRVLAKKAQQAQAQGFALAQAKAKAELAAGQQAAAEVAAADAKASVKLVGKPAALLAAQKVAEAKAKALAYKLEQEALQKAKEEAAAAARAAQLVAKASTEIETLKLFSYGDPKLLLKDLSYLAKKSPAVFEEVWKQATGKLEGMPKTTKAATLQVAKKLHPDLAYPKPKPKAPPLEQLTEKLLKSKNLVKDLEKVEAAQVAELLKAKLPILKTDADQWAQLVKTSPVISKAVQGLLKAQGELELAAAEWKLTDMPTGGMTYVDVFDANGNKLAYFFKVEGGYEVKPPKGLSDPSGNVVLSDAFLTDPKQAAAYAVQVSKAIQLKGAVPKVAAAAPKVAKNVPTPVAPGVMRWSSKYQQPARPEAELGDPEKDLKAGLAVDTRHGHALALDKDKIENFDVAFTTELVDGKRETVVRFKVTEHASKEVLEKLRELPGAANTEYKFRKLKDLKSPTLDMGALAEKMPGVWTAGAQVGNARVTMNRAHSTEGDRLAAGHNLVEIRFPEPKDAGKAYTQTAKVLKEIGIDPERPSETELRVYKRAKIMAYVDKDAAKELTKVPQRVPAAVDGVWARAVKRNPKLAEIERDVELREVSPGHVALYSPTIAKMYEEAGVRWLEHSLAGDAQVLEQMFLHDRAGGLLSSRERFQRGLVFRGMSTDTDFTSGGADSVFMRLKTTTGSGGHYGTTIEVDPRELGRLDAYFFNQDNYGAAGKGAVSDRMTVDQIQHTVREGRLSDSNEIMMQRQVAVPSVRRVRTIHRRAIVERMQAAGVSEVNGIPLDEFFVE
jgi:hypothetical protein